MKALFKKPLQLYRHGCQRAHATASARHAGLLAYMDNCSPRERRLMLISAGVTFLGLMLVTSSAHAAGEGIAGMFDTAATQSESAKKSLATIFKFAGLGCAGYGGWNWFRKGKEGDHSQISGNQIVTPIMGGAALGATGFVLARGGETIGIPEE